MKVFILVSALLLLSALAVKGTPVYDIFGEPLKPDTAYFVTSAFTGAGGGGLYPRWGISPTEPSKAFVAQHSRDINQGTPVFFSPVGSDVVQLMTDVRIQFRILGTNRRMWKLEDPNQQNGRQYVTLDHVSENPVAYFKIAESGKNIYKLMYCPSVKDSIDAPCGDLGIHHENGKNLLGLRDRPFLVVFIKADNISTRPLHDIV